MNRKIVGIILAVLLVGLAVLPGCGVSKAELDECKTLVAEQSTTIEEQAGQIEAKNDELETKNTQIAELQAELTESPQDTSLKDPTHDQLMGLLEEYQEQARNYSYKTHTIYSYQFLKHVKENGIRGFPVVVVFNSNRVLLFTGFETTDKGLIYILPAIWEEGCNAEVLLEEGKSYWALNSYSPFGSSPDIIDSIMILD